ncbi:zinc-binding dehydrogenase [Streptomyces sp. SID5910]|nr:zinc-binding dehydrogenase [Streptomyces sp. SID5910]
MNFADVKARADGYRVASLPHRPGLEVSGRVRAVGERVEGLRVGQEVAALVDGGGYAEVVLAEAARVLPLPAGLDLRTAATLPTVLPTAHALVHEVGRLRAGESVLVHGAAGGIGTAVGQLARAAGAGAVFGVVSGDAKAAHALKYGYDEVFRSDTFDADVRRVTGGRGVDLVLDPVGGGTLRRGLEVLAVFGRLVSFGNAGGAEPWHAGQAELYPRGRSVGGFPVLALARSSPDDLRALTERALRTVLDGTVTLPVTAEFPLSDAADAHRLIGGRTSTGKLLLRTTD